MDLRQYGSLCVIPVRDMGTNEQPPLQVLPYLQSLHSFLRSSFFEFSVVYECIGVLMSTDIANIHNRMMLVFPQYRENIV